MTGKTLNWHFTTACNFDCRYCFIAPCRSLGLAEYKTALKKIAPHFSRVNFVGGEPTVSPHLLPLMRLARSLSLDCTIVTNGYNVIRDKALFAEIASLCSCIGISVDSLNDETNAKIGRAHKGEIITRSEYVDLCHAIKNSGTRLKINTVVSSLNKDEDFSDFYREINPDRIKLFQVLKPERCLKHCYDNFLISQAEFAAFVARHGEFSSKIVAENNDAMTSAYYMLDAECCFIDEKHGGKSPSIARSDISAEYALTFADVDAEKYNFRYTA